MAATGKGARTRQRIVRCAASLLAERGVTETNLADVVQSAQLTKGALYFHFASKDELISGIELEYNADSQRMVAGIETDPDPVRRLVRLSFALMRRQLSSSLARAHNRLMLARVTPDVQRHLPVPPTDWAALILDWLDQGVRQGRLPSALDLRCVAETLDDYLIGAVTAHHVEVRSVDPLQRMASFWRVFLLPALATEPHRRAELDRLVAEEERRPPGPDPFSAEADSPQVPAGTTGSG